jgi:hypothetical protein
MHSSTAPREGNAFIKVPVRKSEALHKLARAPGAREAEDAALPRPTEPAGPHLGFLRWFYAEATQVAGNGGTVEID